MRNTLIQLSVALRLAAGLAALFVTPRTTLAAPPPISVVIADAVKLNAPGTWNAVPQDDGSLALIPPQNGGIVRAIITVELNAPPIEDFLTANLPVLESGLRWSRDGQPVINHAPASDTAIARLKGQGHGGRDGLAIWHLKRASGTLVAALLLGETKAVEDFEPALATIFDNIQIFPSPPADWTRFSHASGLSLVHPPTWKVTIGDDSLLIVPDDAKPGETFQITGGTSGKEPAANTPATLNNLDAALAQIYPGAKREGEPDTFPVGPQIGVMLRYALPDRNGLTVHVYAVIIDDAAFALIASGQPDALSAREALIRQTFSTIRYTKPAPPPPDAAAPQPGK